VRPAGSRDVPVARVRPRLPHEDMHVTGLPPAAGLYDPRFEHDECGIGFVAHVDGRPRRDIVTMALEGLRGVKHRGAVASDGKTGDGAGGNEGADYAPGPEHAPTDEDRTWHSSRSTDATTAWPS
jgi:hypothetical protein